MYWSVLECNLASQRMQLYQNFMPPGVPSPMIPTAGYQPTILPSYTQGYQPASPSIHPMYPFQMIPGIGWTPSMPGIQQPQMGQWYNPQIPVNFTQLQAGVGYQPTTVPPVNITAIPQYMPVHMLRPQPPPVPPAGSRPVYTQPISNQHRGNVPDEVRSHHNRVEHGRSRKLMQQEIVVLSDTQGDNITNSKKTGEQPAENHRTFDNHEDTEDLNCLENQEEDRDEPVHVCEADGRDINIDINTESDNKLNKPQEKSSGNIQITANGESNTFLGAGRASEAQWKKH